jgi:hypothetical protein
MTRFERCYSHRIFPTEIAHLCPETFQLRARDYVCSTLQASSLDVTTFLGANLFPLVSNDQKNCFQAYIYLVRSQSFRPVMIRPAILTLSY